MTSVAKRVDSCGRSFSPYFKRRKAKASTKIAKLKNIFISAAVCFGKNYVSKIQELKGKPSLIKYINWKYSQNVGCIEFAKHFVTQETKSSVKSSILHNSGQEWWTRPQSARVLNRKTFFVIYLSFQ